MELFNPVTIVVLITLFAPIGIVLKKLIDGEKITLSKFNKGIKGEDRVARYLDNLSGDFKYFRNVKLPGAFSDIDIVAIGEKGVFAIEVKSHKGNITFASGKLLRGGKETEKDFLKQVKSEAAALSDYIKEKSGIEIFVMPVIVFSDSKAVIHFGLNPVDGVYVVNMVYMEKLSDSFNGDLDQAKRYKIIEVLKNLSI